eukprot:scaffold188_cov107-Isochrysis_galbana.AAC.2
MKPRAARATVPAGCGWLEWRAVWMLASPNSPQSAQYSWSCRTGVMEAGARAALTSAAAQPR